MPKLVVRRFPPCPCWGRRRHRTVAEGICHGSIGGRSRTRGMWFGRIGMLSRKQRRLAIAGLMGLMEDPALDATSRTWVFQALREISGERIEWRGGIGTWGTCSGSVTNLVVRGSSIRLN